MNWELPALPPALPEGLLGPPEPVPLADLGNFCVGVGCLDCLCAVDHQVTVSESETLDAHDSGPD